MSRILALYRRDLQHVAGNVIAILVCVGLAFMPSLYAWFNIAGGWDPYANTGQLKVALANSDEGIQGSVVPYRINVGERVVSSLAGSQKIGYVVTDEDDAVEGVSSGAYYAAVVIPQDFTAKLLSVLTADPAHPQLDYYVNEKRNAIAAIVAGKASASVQAMVAEGFSEAVASAATDLMDEASGLMDNDSLALVAHNLKEALATTTDTVRRTAAHVEAYQGVVASLRGVVDGAEQALGTSAPSLDAASLLGQTAGGVRELDAAVQTAKDGASAAVRKGTDALEDVESAMDRALEVADGKTDELAAALQQAAAVAQSRRDGLQDLYDALGLLDGEVRSLTEGREKEVGGVVLDVQYTHAASASIAQLRSRLQAALADLDALIQTTQATKADIQASQADLAQSRAQLKDLVAQARQSIAAAKDDYDGRFAGSLDELARAVDAAASDASGAAERLHAQAGKLTPVLHEASSGLTELEATLARAASKARDAANKLQDLHDRLEGALASGDLDLVRSIFSADSDALVDFVAAPVELAREPVYAVENNGSAMAPYYTTMALWVGGTLMGILLYAGVSDEAREQTGAKPRHAYVARLLFFLTIGAAQSSMLLAGDLYFLGIQCEEPLLFFITGWVASTVFINIIYALSSALGDVGKAVGVLLMVVQVAGSGGTFPVEMLPPLFQTLYRFLPFVYSENAMREAICGVYGNHWAVAVGTLALYLVPALVLGLVLAKPLVRVNEWIEEHLEKTKLM